MASACPLARDHGVTSPASWRRRRRAAPCGTGHVRHHQVETDWRSAGRPAPSRAVSAARSPPMRTISDFRADLRPRPALSACGPSSGARSVQPYHRVRLADLRSTRKDAPGCPSWASAPGTASSCSWRAPQRFTISAHPCWNPVTAAPCTPPVAHLARTNHPSTTVVHPRSRARCAPPCGSRQPSCAPRRTALRGYRPFSGLGSGAPGGPS